MLSRLKNVPLETVVFVQYPGTTGATEGVYAGKVKPNDYLADPMMQYIRDDQPFNLASVGDDRGSTVDPNAPVSTEAPVDPDATTDDAPVVDVSGQTATQYTCTVTNSY